MFDNLDFSGDSGNTDNINSNYNNDDNIITALFVLIMAVANLFFNCCSQHFSWWQWGAVIF